MGSMSVSDAIKNIHNFYLKFYNIQIKENDDNFLNAILQDVDSKSWQEGYNQAEEDNEIY